MWQRFNVVSHKDFCKHNKNKISPNVTDTDHQLLEVHQKTKKTTTHKSMDRKAEPGRVLPVQASSQSSAAVRWLGRAHPTHILLRHFRGLNERRRRASLREVWTRSCPWSWKKTQNPPPTTRRASGYLESRVLNTPKRNATDAHFDAPKKADVYCTRASTLEKIRLKHQPQMNVDSRLYLKRTRKSWNCTYYMSEKKILSSNSILEKKASTLTLEERRGLSPNRPEDGPYQRSVSKVHILIERLTIITMYFCCSVLRWKLLCGLIDGLKFGNDDSSLYPQLWNFLFGILRHVVTRHEREREPGPRWHSERCERGWAVIMSSLLPNVFPDVQWSPSKFVCRDTHPPPLSTSKCNEINN